MAALDVAPPEDARLQAVGSSTLADIAFANAVARAASKELALERVYDTFEEWNTAFQDDRDSAIRGGDLRRAAWMRELHEQVVSANQLSGSWRVAQTYYLNVCRLWQRGKWKQDSPFDFRSFLTVDPTPAAASRPP